MIKTLKIDDLIYQNIDEHATDENGEPLYDLPTDIDKFKALAIDTVNWQIGDNVTRSLGNTQTNLSASNAKAVVLLAKLIGMLNPDTTGLSQLELDSYNKMLALADNGYSDSELLNSSLAKVSEYIAAGTDKVARIMAAQSIEEVIAILNEE